MDIVKKRERIDLLLTIGREVLEESLAEHAKQGGDPREICFDDASIPAVVDQYEQYLEQWRKDHIDEGRLVDGDKIAAFTGTLIMRNNVFYSAIDAVNTPVAAFVNQLFAIRIAQLFVQRNRFGFNPPAHKMLIHCFTRCYDHDPAMTSWTVATMSEHLRMPNVKEPAYAD